MFENIDVYFDLTDLRDNGLTEEEIAGYLDFFEINYNWSKNESV